MPCNVVVHGGAFNCKKRPLDSTCPSISPSACISADTTERISVKCEIAEFYKSIWKAPKIWLQSDKNDGTFYLKTHLRYIAGGTNSTQNYFSAVFNTVILLAVTCTSTILLRFRGNNGYANAPPGYTYIAQLVHP